ncbi:MAG: thrombospondin type 3 repeat-containing protein [Bacteroidota bacterium]
MLPRRIYIATNFTLFLLPSILFSQAFRPYTHIYGGISFRSYESLRIAYFSQASQSRFTGPFIQVEHSPSPALAFSLEYQHFNDAPRPLDKMDPISTQYINLWGSFKFNNGSLLATDSRTSPFITVGVGGQIQEGRLSSHVGLGTGISFRMNKRIQIVGKFVFQRLLDQRYSSFSPSIGLGYTLYGRKLPKLKNLDVSPELESIMFSMDMDKDRDGDGLPDRLDVCPDEAGMPKAKGCPDKPTISLQKEEQVVPRPKRVGNISIPIQSYTREKPTYQEQGQEIPNQHPCAIESQEGKLLISTVFFPESVQLTEEGLEKVARLGAIMSTCENRHLRLEANYPQRGKLIRNLIMRRIYKLKYLLVNELNISQDRVSIITTPLTASLSENYKVSFEQISYKLNNMNH